MIEFFSTPTCLGFILGLIAGPVVMLGGALAAHGLWFGFICCLLSLVVMLDILLGMVQRDREYDERVAATVAARTEG